MRRIVITWALSALGCGVAAPAPSSEAPRTEVIEHGDALFRERGLEGAFVVRRVGIDAPYRSIGGPRIDQRFVPASTFKVPSTLIGLETGVIADASYTLRWDGVERELPAWNRDHDLRSAIGESVVWWYQEVARRVGHARMRELVGRLRYGSAEIGVEASIDRFWLEGPLAISPREQVDFLARLTRGELPVSERSVAVLRDVMPSVEHGDTIVRWKTGTHADGAGSGGHAWLVGWVERDDVAIATFALLLLAHDGAELRELTGERRALATELLELEGLLPR